MSKLLDQNCDVDFYIGDYWTDKPIPPQHLEVWWQGKWNESEIQEELEDWCGFEYHNSDYMRYGWNDEDTYGNRV